MNDGKLGSSFSVSSFNIPSSALLILCCILSLRTYETLGEGLSCHLMKQGSMTGKKEKSIKGSPLPCGERFCFADFEYYPEFLAVPSWQNPGLFQALQ